MSESWGLQRLQSNDCCNSMDTDLRQCIILALSKGLCTDLQDSSEQWAVCRQGGELVGCHGAGCRRTGA